MANSHETIDNETGEIITQAGTMEQVSLAIGLSRAEIDQQVSTAKNYPRSIAKAKQNTLSLVTIDEQSAQECVYALPRGGKSIMGPSVRMAEIIANAWGNNRVGARVVHVDRAEKFVEAEGVFHDLESNSATTARVRRRIVDSKGRLYNDDMIIMTGNAACSIAKRNAILGGVPKAIWRDAYDAAQGTIKGDVKTLVERREGAMKAFAAFGVKPEQVFAVLQVGGLDDITLETMPILIGMHSGLKSGETTVEEMFGVGGKPGTGAKQTTADKMKELAAGKDKEADKGAAEKGKKAEPEKQAETKDKGKAETETKAGKDDGDDFPGDRPSGQGQADQGQGERRVATGDEIEAARDRGHDAYHNGMRRETTPKDLKGKGHEAELEAWLAGFDAAEADNASEGDLRDE